MYWQIYTKRKSVPNRNNLFAATRWPVLGCPLNVTARESNRPHGQMNFSFALPGNPNKEIQIRQVDYLKPDLVRSRCQSKTIQTKNLSANLDIGRGYVLLICNQKRSGLDKLISKRTSNIRIFVTMPSSI